MHERTDMALLCLLLFLILRVAAVPQVALPINAQVPPVARVSEPFSFQFASSTFSTSSGANLAYTLHDAPSWLEFNGATRTFSGRPSSKDVGWLIFGLVASDETGSVVTQVTFVVVDYQGPRVVKDISSQLAGAGPQSNFTILEYPPAYNFAINISRDTFVGTSNLVFYAVSADRSPLPSWMIFNSASLTFTGLTPPLANWPQTFGFQLIASDIPGFAGAAVYFAITISQHQLVFSSLNQTVLAKGGDNVSFDILQSQLRLDRKPVSSSDILNASAITPSWLHFDPSTLSLSGNAPNGATTTSVTVMASDRYGDTAVTVVNFLFQPDYFAEEIGTLNATIGKVFSYQIPTSLFTVRNLSLSFNFGEASPWLRFDQTSMTIIGSIPDTAKPGDIQASITVSSNNSVRSIHTGASESQSFIIRLTRPSAHLATSTTPTKLTAATPTPTTRSANTSQSGSRHLTKGEIAAAVILPVLFAIAILILAICCLRRRRRSMKRVSSDERKLTIVGPINPYMPEREEPQMEEIGIGVTTDDAQSHRSQAGPGLRPPPSAAHRKSASSFIGEGEVTILEQFATSSYSVAGRPISGKYSIPSIRMVERSRHSHSSRRSSGLPLERRLTGLGHGRPLDEQSGSVLVGLANRRRYESTSGESCSTESTALLSPSSNSISSPVQRRESLTATMALAMANPDMSIQIVRDDSGSAPLDKRTIQEKRKSFIRSRASGVNPFFAAGTGSVRAPSTSNRHPRSTRSFTSGLSDRIEAGMYQPHNSRRTPAGPGKPHPSSIDGLSRPRFPRVISEPSTSEPDDSDRWETADGSSDEWDDDPEESQWMFTGKRDNLRNPTWPSHGSRRSPSEVLASGRTTQIISQQTKPTTPRNPASQPVQTGAKESYPTTSGNEPQSAAYEPGRFQSAPRQTSDISMSDVDDHPAFL